MIDQRSHVRVALVGYGLGGSAFHAPFIDANPRLDLVAVVTSNDARAAEVRDRYAGAEVLESVDALFERIEDADLVVVSTPNAFHVPIAERALTSGRPVVIDKPVAPSADEVRHLGDLADRSGVSAIPFHNRRWDGDFLTVRKLLNSDGLGPLFTFESRFERWRPLKATGSGRAWTEEATQGGATGILYDLGPHLIDQAITLFGRPSAVYAEVSTRRAGAEVDDDVFLALISPDGPAVHLTMSAIAAEPGPRFRLLGSEGAFVKFGIDVQEAALVAHGSPADPRWGEEPPEHWGVLTIGTDRRSVPTERGAYQDFYAGIASCVLDGAPPPIDIGDAVTVAEVISAAQASAASGSVSALP